MKILLVEKNSLYLEGLNALLLANGYEVVGTVENERDLLEKANLLKPDLILLDIDNCFENNDISCLKLVKAELPAIKIVVLTMKEDDEYLFEAVRNGAAGYLLKRLKIQEFLELLKKIAIGELSITPDMTAKVFKEFSHLLRGEKKI